MPEPEIVDIPISDLQVDTRNARLVDEQSNQQTALLAMARQQGKRLLKLATDIVENGLDPMTLTGVVATSGQRKRYVVIEGNRRFTALKALETPSMVAAAFGPGDQKKLLKLSERFRGNRISSVRCVLFHDEKDMDHWVQLRHGGMREGIGLVEWGADEKDRYAARHGQRSPAGQIIDFVEQSGGLSDEAKRSSTKVISTIARLVSTPEVREKIGIEIVSGQVMMRYPAAEVLKSLTRVVEDLKTEKINVGDLYKKEARVNYANGLPIVNLPDPTTRLSGPVSLGSPTPSEPPIPKARPKPRPKPLADRDTLIPQTSRLNVTDPRINAIYNELLTLNISTYTNCCSVMLRVFVELSVDHYIEQNKLLTNDERRNTKLAKCLKVVADDLKSKGKIDTFLETAIYKIAEDKFVLSATATTFNQYVHNQYTFPKPVDLKAAWDELNPLMERLWP